MCGIAGIYNLNDLPVSAVDVKKMTDAIRHRGPDGEGQYVDGSLGLGHRRLSIIDLTEAGSQPMASAGGDCVISYNGEVYNFGELRQDLEDKGHTFRSQTDTEVVLNAYLEWGTDCVDHFNGMFAFAIWDKRCQRLFLARDRFGVKPLYYWYRGGRFVFASEIKAMLTLPWVSAEVWPEALNEYFTFQNIFSDRTLFKEIRLLPAGHTLTLEKTRGKKPIVSQYWDFDFCSSELSMAEAEEQLFDLFERAVKRQMVSDVELGSYLSGGVDSGSVTGIAASIRPRITTFTGGFDLSSASGLELGFDERDTSEALSHHFKTEHYEVVLKAGDMEAVMPDLTWHMEDLRMGQNYPNYFVARLASKFVKVVLSGAGGDELFAGYPWRYYRALGSTDKEDYFKRYYGYWQRLMGDDEKEHCFTPEVLKAVGSHQPFADFCNVFNGQSFALNTPEEYLNKSLYFEAKTFLHGFFVVEDKLSMAHGLETRVPFMDNDLVDLAMKIPIAHKLANLDKTIKVDENQPGKHATHFQRTGDGKLILRQTMQRLAPTRVATLKKQGFSGPDASWFRGESVDYVRHLLVDGKPRIADYLNQAFVRRILEEHLSGKVNHRLLIWSFLSFEWWLRKFLP